MILRFLLIVFVIYICGVTACSQNPPSDDSLQQQTHNKEKDTLTDEIEIGPVLEIERYASKAEEALIYCRENKLNTSFSILIDMSQHSGLSRMVVWNYEQDTMLYTFPVSHGCCQNNWGEDESKTDPIFSNLEGSHCSSLGKYKLGKRGYSNWGIHVKYLMHGLESSNSNALSRNIVFHSWEAINDEAVYPDGTPEGWGCPAISNANFKLIDAMLQEANEPVLMWIYY